MSRQSSTSFTFHIAGDRIGLPVPAGEFLGMCIDRARLANCTVFTLNMHRPRRWLGVIACTHCRIHRRCSSSVRVVLDEDMAVVTFKDFAGDEVVVTMRAPDGSGRAILRADTAINVVRHFFYYGCYPDWLS